MKTIQYFAASLLLISGILHVIPLFKPPVGSDAVIALFFGIIFFSIGVLLLSKKNYGPVLGVIFPGIGLTMGFLVIGMKNWDTLLKILFAIDAVVIVCCLLLLINKNKT